jgi:acetolactate synthase-1/2/3 large subunit
MKHKLTVAEIIIQKLEKVDVGHIFLLPGGGCMYLVDALARSRKIMPIPMLHEQSVGVAAEAYAQYGNALGVALVTTGPGATNAITPCAAAWTDSTPMIFISGQVKRADSAEKLGVRQKGFQELPITKILEPITKKVIKLDDASKVLEVMDELIYLAKSGRPGPVWLDIPLDIQNEIYEVTDAELNKNFQSPHPSNKEFDFDQLVSDWNKARKPILLLGNGIRLANALADVNKLICTTQTPALLSWKALDFLDEVDPLNAGRPGAIAQKWSNLAQQEADFILVLGARLDQGQVGYRLDAFAKNAKKYIVDIDINELKKFNDFAFKQVFMDVREFLIKLDNQMHRIKKADAAWIGQIQEWKRVFPIIQEKHLNPAQGVNLYRLIDKLSEELKHDIVFVPGSSGACSEVSMQSFKVKIGQRVFNSEGLGPMGFGIPATIGAYLASGKKIISVDGDGGFLMNIQELGTIALHKMPIKIFVLNNNGYGSIKNTQDNYFNGRRLGTDPKSGLGIPEILPIVEKFGIKVSRIENDKNLINDIRKVINDNNPHVCEVIVDPNQITEPKVKTVRTNEGELVTSEPSDLYPK